MSEFTQHYTTKFRFECFSCRTKIEQIMPFRRKLCPLCGKPMFCTSILTKPNEGEKGGETQ